MDSRYYPLGAANDPRAPYNQVDPSEKEFDVCVSQSLSRSTVVSTDQYIEFDEGGIDTSETSWEEVYAKQKLTPLELILCCEALAKEKLKEGNKNIQIKDMGSLSLKYIIENCKGWTEDEFCVEPE